jgi:hypothetical protein
MVARTRRKRSKVKMNFTMRNNKGKEIEFRFIAIGAPYGLGAINNGDHPLWEVSSNGFTLGQWRVETIAEHEDGKGWCLHGAHREYDLDEFLADYAKQKSIQALTGEKVDN